jgi:HK97 family phage major capsid protein
MTIDQKGLAVLIQEASALSRKPRLTVQEERRNAWLLSSISVLKQGGITLADLDQEDINSRSAAAGLQSVNLPKPLNEVEQRAKGFAGFVRGERRSMGVQPLSAQIGTFGGLGYFCPTDFYPTMWRSLKAHDCLFDDDTATVIKTTNGRPLPIPTGSNTEHSAVVVAEAGSRTPVDINSLSHVVLGNYSYSTDQYYVSLEAMQDVSGAISVMDLANTFFQDALARGIGKDLVTGTGGGVKPLGLIPSLEAIGAPIVTANGSAVNDGSANTGANSLGSPDFSAALAQLDKAYFGTKTRWLMNASTLATLSGQLNKFGDILNLVKYVDGIPTIFGIPVGICPSMDSIGASNVPVVLGDASRWMTRLIADTEGAGLKTFSEAPNTAEKGIVGISCFLRADGALLWSDSSSPAPFVLIRNFS